MKDYFVEKLIWIIFVHIIWFMTLVVSTICLEGVNPTKTIAYFILEPICILVLVPLVLHIIMLVAVRKSPKCNRTDKMILIGFDVVMCILMYVLFIMNMFAS